MALLQDGGTFIWVSWCHSACQTLCAYAVRLPDEHGIVTQPLRGQVLHAPVPLYRV